MIVLEWLYSTDTSNNIIMILFFCNFFFLNQKSENHDSLQRFAIFFNIFTIIHFSFSFVFLILCSYIHSLICRFKELSTRSESIVIYNKKKEMPETENTVVEIEVVPKEITSNTNPYLLLYVINLFIPDLLITRNSVLFIDSLVVFSQQLVLHAAKYVL